MGLRLETEAREEDEIWETQSEALVVTAAILDTESQARIQLGVILWYGQENISDDDDIGRNTATN